MRKFTIPLLFAVSLLLPHILLADEPADFAEFSQQMNGAMDNQQAEFEQYKNELEAEFAAYKKFYEEEFINYKNQIEQQWGEFIAGGKTLWVSYVENGETRRQVNYETGQVLLDILLDEGVDVESVDQRINTQIYTLMNSTEADAFKTDVVSQNVEKKLVDVSQSITRGSLSDKRLFTFNDLTSLVLTSDNFVKVGSKPGIKVSKVMLNSKMSDKKIVRAQFEVPDTIAEKAARFNEAVSEAAVREKLPAALIFAIMETESSFNPMAKSDIPAYGLMQVVPHSAGKDATAYLYGKASVLAPSYLYSSDNNIRIGSAYLHVLYYKYLTKVVDPTSRLYCAIAAYNTGPGNVARAFINLQNFGVASKKINHLSAEEVYQKLKKNLPHQETRHYMERVSSRMENYL